MNEVIQYILTAGYAAICNGVEIVSTAGDDTGLTMFQAREIEGGPIVTIDEAAIMAARQAIFDGQFRTDSGSIMRTMSANLTGDPENWLLDCDDRGELVRLAFKWQLKLNQDNRWPFYLKSDDHPARYQALLKDRYYIFPETSTSLPEYTPISGWPTSNAAQSAYMLSEGEGSILFFDQDELGVADVLLTGEQYVAELTARGINLDDLGFWGASK